jgi:CRP/FNR family transcriptional regulator
MLTDIQFARLAQSLPLLQRADAALVREFQQAAAFASQRLATVMAIVDEVAFRRMDARLASFLLTRSRVQNPIRITHQQIAAELGSSREVISRLLEDLAARGRVRATRGEVDVLDAEGLE